MDYKLSYSLDDYYWRWNYSKWKWSLKKYLDNVKYERSKIHTYNNNTYGFGTGKINNLRAFFFTKIYENPIFFISNEKKIQINININGNSKISLLIL